MKKAQGLSMNVIIIAALALLVLVILSMVFMSRSTIFVTESKGCAQKGGDCVGIGESCPDGTVSSILPDMVCDDGEKCCITGE